MVDTINIEQHNTGDKTMKAYYLKITSELIVEEIGGKVHRARMSELAAMRWVFFLGYAA